MAKLIATPANATRAESLVQKMKPDLQEVYTEMLDLITKADAQDVESHYAVGVIVKNVRKEVKKYGNNAVEKLAKALRWDDSTLYRCGAVAACWTPEEFEDLRSRRDARYNRPLTWSHFLVICEVDDIKVRDKLLDAALAEGLSVSDTKNKRNMLLHMERQAAVVPSPDATVAAVGKEPRQKPLEPQPDEEAQRQTSNDVTQVLGALLELSDLLFDEIEDQSKDVFGAIANMPAGGDKPDVVLSQLDQLKTSQRKLRDLCDQVLKKISTFEIKINAMQEPKRPASGGKSRKGASKTASSKMLAG